MFAFMFCMAMNNTKISSLPRKTLSGTLIKIASLGRQEPQPAGTAEWPATLRFGKIFGTTSVVRSIENSQDVPKRFTDHDFLQLLFIF